MATLQLEVITAEREVLSEEVEMVVAPGREGELGILPRHAPLLTSLQPGELRARKPGGEEIILAVHGGFLEVLPDRVIVLADAAEEADEIDIARAEEARRRAQDRLAHPETQLDLGRAQASLQRAMVRLRIAERRRRRGGPPTLG
jgi:F-type H+-transporting ATPase subunit epsilon